jgi:D-aminopeptidase
VRTGVTVIRPRPGSAREDPLFAGCHRLNGNGDMTGLEWIRESGVLTTPVALTNTHSLGVVRDALIAAEVEETAGEGAVYWCMPVVGETYDGTLNDIDGMHVTAAHVRDALASAQETVAEGSVGGGTGMICHEFKGGIGTASRRLAAEDGGFTVGALVQANHGRRAQLRVDGAPVGRVLGTDRVPSPYDATPEAAGSGSIVAILATDAPLLPHQCERLAQRAGIGIARAGGGMEDSSGDLFLAFATGNHGIPRADYGRPAPLSVDVRMLPDARMTALFEAAAEAAEESVLNALLAAGTMTGRDGRTAHGLEGDLLLAALQELRRPQPSPR